MSILLYNAAPIPALASLWQCVQTPQVDMNAFEPAVTDLWLQAGEPQAFGMNDTEREQVQDALQGLSQAASRFSNAAGKIASVNLQPSMASLINAWPSRLYAADDIGHEFAITGLIGGGGFSQIYHGHNLEDGTLVAIKVIEVPEGVSRELVERSLREEYSMMKAMRPGTAPRVFRIGTMNGKLAMVMEHMEGQDLERMAEEWRHDMKNNEHLNRLIDACRAAVASVAALHEQGIVHCDIKPTNFMSYLHAKSGTPRARVFDFGIALREGVLHPFLNGTPAFMAPEVWSGTQPADFSRDVFALGVTLYEILTGKNPFPGDSVEEIARNVMTHDPERPSVVLLHDRPDLASKLSPNTLRIFDDIVMQALSRNEGLRFQDAEDLLRQFDQFHLQDEASEASPLSATA